MRASILALLAGCATEPPPHAVAPVVAPIVVAVPAPPEIALPLPPPSEPAQLAQSPETKLKLGHYRNTRRGVGAVIDLTRPDEARLRYDGTDEVLSLLPTPGQFGRTDYLVNGDRVVLQVWTSGRVRVYVTPSTGVDLWRDADAEPL